LDIGDWNIQYLIPIEKEVHGHDARLIHHNFGDGNPLFGFTDSYAGSDGAGQAVQAQEAWGKATPAKGKGVGGCHRGGYRSKAQSSNIQHPMQNLRGVAEFLEAWGAVQAIDEFAGGKEASLMKKFKISVNGNWYEVEIKDLNESPISVLVDGELYQVELGPEISDIEAAGRGGEQPQILVSQPAPEAGRPVAAEGEVIAPMPGKILAMNVGVGDRVQYKDVLCILEAMKMENEIMAPVGGVVKEIRVAEGQDVLYGDVLFVMGS
jgi:biotin carboxyl carrier protein